LPALSANTADDRQSKTAWRALSTRLRPTPMCGLYSSSTTTRTTVCFDHVSPPVAPPAKPHELVEGLTIGRGFRVPCIIVSPWTLGGCARKGHADGMRRGSAAAPRRRHVLRSGQTCLEDRHRNGVRSACAAPPFTLNSSPGGLVSIVIPVKDKKLATTVCGMVTLVDVMLAPETFSTQPANEYPLLAAAIMGPPYPRRTRLRSPVSPARPPRTRPVS
jgi:hypothetical protein